LIVDDDSVFVKRLARAMSGRGFSVETAETRADALALIRNRPPRFGIIDLRLADGSGLDVIEAVRIRRDDSRLLILTGYGNIANAVTAVKLGAVDYLAKPANADDVFRALLEKDDVKANTPEHPMSAARVRWEHIQRIYELCERNLSETARQLDMHRRTLQRILSKHAPR
jgi:two-component system response regulator RegA